MDVKVQRLHPEAILPYYDHPGDAGLAVHTVTGAVLKPGTPVLLDTGWAMEIPAGHVALVMDRSSMGSKSIKTAGGVIDAGYRGMYRIILLNLGHKEYEVKKGDKIAQVLIMPVARAVISEVMELSASSRGAGGFGSTGR